MPVTAQPFAALIVPEADLQLSIYLSAFAEHGQLFRPFQLNAARFEGGCAARPMQSRIVRLWIRLRLEDVCTACVVACQRVPIRLLQ